MVARLIELIRLRNTHPAFGGQFSCAAPAEHRLVLTWTSGEQFARLEVDLKARTGVVHYSSSDGVQQFQCADAPALTAD